MYFGFSRERLRLIQKMEKRHRKSTLLAQIVKQTSISQTYTLRRGRKGTRTRTGTVGTITRRRTSQTMKILHQNHQVTASLKTSDTTSFRRSRRKRTTPPNNGSTISKSKEINLHSLLPDEAFMTTYWTFWPIRPAIYGPHLKTHNAQCAAKLMNAHTCWTNTLHETTQRNLETSLCIHYGIY